MIKKYLALIYNVSVRSIHKQFLRMDTAYYRNVEGTDQFRFMFRLVHKDLKVDRSFNFERQLSETASTFISRLGTNVEKFLVKKNRKKTQDTKYDLNVQLILNGDKVSNDLECRKVFEAKNNVILELLGISFNVVIDSPWVDALMLPASVLSTFPVFPSKFEVFNTNIHQSDLIWYTSKDKKLWSENSRGPFFIPSNESIGCHFKLMCIPRNEGSEGPSIEVESEAKIEASPGICPFEKRHCFTKEKTSKKMFRVVTYNILADLYCDSDYTRDELYPYCPNYALQFDYRKQLILKELMGYNADIICLQEVDRRAFKYDLQTILSHLGFEGVYAIKGGEVAEGVACFYKKEKFERIKDSRVVFCEHIDKDPLYANIWVKIAENPNLVTRILELKTTLQTVLLQSKEDEKELVLLANTHLYFHPDADHIRLLQGGLAMTYIQHWVKVVQEEFPDKRISLVFCGDFNSVPECGIYRLFTTGSVPEDVPDFRSNQEEAVENLRLEQNIPLASACGTPQFTNFTTGFADCLDYIFYQKDNLKVSQVVPLPSNEELTANTALPSVVFPSDHIALICDLEWL